MFEPGLNVFAGNNGVPSWQFSRVRLMAMPATPEPLTSTVADCPFSSETLVSLDELLELLEVLELLPELENSVEPFDVTVVEPLLSILIDRLLEPLLPLCVKVRSAATQSPASLMVAW